MKSVPNAWVLPGGHLEQNESFEQGICREILEETGITIPDLSPPKMFLIYENSNQNAEDGTQFLLFFKSQINENSNEIELKLNENEI